MSAVGPRRLILIKAGKFDYAEVELYGSLHLVGPNNVGKTSLVAALQFLYVDQQGALHFTSPLADSRRYYFPSHYSHILFECLTPVSYRVVGVRGLGPLKQYEFERFTYQGEFEWADFIDEERKPREPDQVKLRLVDRGYMALEPHQLRAALTDTNDARGVTLGLVPLRQKHQYEHFRRVFQNLLRLSHIRQEDLKELLIEAHRGEFPRLEIDLSTDYKTQYRRVTDERDSIADLQNAQPNIEKALNAAVHRDTLRSELPVLYFVIGDRHRSQRDEFKRQQIEHETQRRALEADREEIDAAIEHLGTERDAAAEKRGEIRRGIEALERMSGEFEAFEPQWAENEIRRLAREFDELTHQLTSAEKTNRPQVERDLQAQQAQRRHLSRILDSVTDLAGVHLRRHLSDDQIRTAFTLLNPELLSQPTQIGGDATGTGIFVTDEHRLVGSLRDFAARAATGKFDREGVHVGATQIERPDLARYVDPGALRTQLEEAERRIAVSETLLRAIDQREQLEARREIVDDQIQRIRLNLTQFAKWSAEKDRLPGLRAQRDECEQRIKAIGDERHAKTRHREHIGYKLDQLGRDQSDAADRERNLDEKIRALIPPPEGFAVAEAMAAAREGPAASLDDLIVQYTKGQQEENRLSRSLVEHLTDVERMTSSRYVAADEAGTLACLRQELDALTERTSAVQKWWQALIVQVRNALKQLVQGLDTLKVKLATLNRHLGSIPVSNLDRVRLDLVAESELVSSLRSIIEGEDMPLFANRRQVDFALGRIGDLLQTRPRLRLLDLFRVHFTVIGGDGVERRYQQLDQIESNGTTITIKVLVNLMLLKSLLADREVRIPFYLDEVASLDNANLSAIVEVARGMGFIAVLASPEPRDVADAVYYLNDHKGRITLDLRRDRVRIDHGRTD